MPQPPQGPFDREGLKARIAFAQEVRKRRVVSPRFLAFIGNLARKCQRYEAMLDSGKKTERTELLKELQIDDGMLRSRWEIAHGPDGLVATLIKSIQAMQEVRMLTEYGDYLAVACAGLNKLCGETYGSSKIPIWKTARTWTGRLLRRPWMRNLKRSKQMGPDGPLLRKELRRSDTVFRRC